MIVLTYCSKIDLKWVIGLNAKCKTIKLLEEMSEELSWFGFNGVWEYVNKRIISPNLGRLYVIKI